jgi:hypothetical protein
MDQDTIQTLVDLLVDLDKADVVVVHDGDTLRYRPRHALTADLTARLKTHKAELLAVLWPPWAVGGGRVDEQDGQNQQDHALEDRHHHELHFEDLVEPGDPCTKCGSLAVWWDFWGNEHCQNCELAGLEASMRLAGRAARLRANTRVNLPLS